MYDEIQTPAFLVDRARVTRNCERMREKARSAGVSLRPHVKTHKTIEGARLQLGGESGPITVSTLAEAEQFATAGFADITYAVPIAPDKLERAFALARSVTLHLVIDRPHTLEVIESRASAAGLRPSVFLKVDCGYHRAGVDPADPASLTLAERLARSESVMFAGLLTHAGHSYHYRDRSEIRRIAEEESGVLTQFAERLRSRGVAVPLLSVGSTPTMSVGEPAPGIGEMRPGNYIFFDAFQAAIGSCSVDDCAATVLTSVIGVYPDQQKLIVDAGALALSKDRGTADLGADNGYGVVCTPDMRPLPLTVRALSQEHGNIAAVRREDVAEFRPGDRLRIIPNHSCLTAAMFDRFHVVEDGIVVEQWRPGRGW